MPVGFGLGGGGEGVIVGRGAVCFGPKGVVRGPQLGGGVQRGPAGSSSSGGPVGVGVGVGRMGVCCAGGG